jgi:hypothetical protein
MRITAIMNRYGHIHIFKGDQSGNLVHLGPNVLKRDYDKHVSKNNRESELYLQSESDIMAFCDNLDNSQAIDLQLGYEIVLNDVGYFEG